MGKIRWESPGFDKTHQAAKLEAVWIPSLTEGIVLGIGAAAPIGPVNIEIARRALRAGFGAGFRLGCGAVTIDALYVIAASLGTHVVQRHPRLIAVLMAAGGLFLIYLGVSSLLAARKGLRMDLAVAAAPPRRNYLTGLVMTATNPMTLAFWVGVMAGATTGGGASWLWAVVAGVIAGALGWVIFFATLMGLAGRASKRVVLFAADLLGGATLLAFGVRAIWRVGQGYL